MLERCDWSSSGVLYYFFPILLVIVGLALLVVLILVLILSFGSYKRSLRALKN